MNQLVIVLITALVTGVVSVSGIWLGSRLTRRNEDRKWRRDHALEAYAEFIQATEAVISESAKAWLIKCGTEEKAKQSAVVYDKLVEMYRAGNRIVLLSSNAVQKPFSALIEHLGMFARMLGQCPKVSEAEQEAGQKKVAELQARFFAAARNDLGVHPHIDTREATEKARWKVWR
jgi:hypothetical protein